MPKEKNKKSQTHNRLNSIFEKLGGLTRKQGLLIYCLTFAVIGGAYYYFVFMPTNDELQKAQAMYESQVARLALYKQRASEISKYETLMAQKNEAFNLAMTALPDKRELPSLLTGISRAGSDAGLAFHLFEPGNEVNKEFFKEIPVSIKVLGRYHQLTDFFFQITRLNRIVNITNVDVRSVQTDNLLEMSCQAVTYMFVEKKEPTDTNQKKK